MSISSVAIAALLVFGGCGTPAEPSAPLERAVIKTDGTLTNESVENDMAVLTGYTSIGDGLASVSTTTESNPMASMLSSTTEAQITSADSGLVSIISPVSKPDTYQLNGFFQIKGIDCSKHYWTGKAQSEHTAAYTNNPSLTLPSRAPDKTCGNPPSNGGGGGGDGGGGEGEGEVEAADASKSRTSTRSASI